MDVFWAAPPVSRTLAVATLAVSVLVHTGFFPARLVIFHTSFLWRIPPQIWRLASAFLLTGPDFGIIFDTYFLYTYGSKLERASPRFSQPGDFFMYLVFVAATIIGLNIFITGGVVFTSALVLALAYTSCQDDRGGSAQFIVVQIPATLVPFAMLFMTLVMGGTGAAKIQATGLVAAHLHDFLVRLWPTFGGGRNLLPTPGFVRRLFETTEASVGNRSYGTAFTSAQRTAGTTGASTGSVLPESWKQRGSGHRLGGD